VRCSTQYARHPGQRSIRWVTYTHGAHTFGFRHPVGPPLVSGTLVSGSHLWFQAHTFGFRLTPLVSGSHLRFQAHTFGFRLTPLVSGTQSVQSTISRMRLHSRWTEDSTAFGWRMRKDPIAAVRLAMEGVCGAHQAAHAPRAARTCGMQKQVCKHLRMHVRACVCVWVCARARALDRVRTRRIPSLSMKPSWRSTLLACLTYLWKYMSMAGSPEAPPPPSAPQ